MAVRITRKAARIPRMNWIITGPSPSTEASPPIVGEGALELCARIHHEGAILGDRLADRSPLKEEKRGGSVDSGELRWLIRVEQDEAWALNTLTRNLYGSLTEEVEAPVKASASTRECPSRVSAKLDGPDRDLCLRARCP